MKFKVGDKVIITAGKDKGKKSSIVKVFPRDNKVLVKDINIYTKHIRSFAGNPGQIIKREKPVHCAKIAILNDEGKPDRIGYKVTAKGKQRIFKKTGKNIPEPKKKKKKK